MHKTAIKGHFKTNIVFQTTIHCTELDEIGEASETERHYKRTRLEASGFQVSPNRNQRTCRAIAYTWKDFQSLDVNV